MLYASFSIHYDVNIATGSLIGRKYCTKLKFRQTLGGWGLKNIFKTIYHSFSADSWITSSWLCPSCDCLQIKSIAQMRRPDVSILICCQHTGT